MKIFNPAPFKAPSTEHLSEPFKTAADEKVEYGCFNIALSDVRTSFRNLVRHVDVRKSFKNLIRNVFPHGFKPSKFTIVPLIMSRPVPQTGLAPVLVPTRLPMAAYDKPPPLPQAWAPELSGLEQHIFEGILPDPTPEPTPDPIPDATPEPLPMETPRRLSQSSAPYLSDSEQEILHTIFASNPCSAPTKNVAPTSAEKPALLESSAAKRVWLERSVGQRVCMANACARRIQMVNPGTSKKSMESLMAFALAFDNLHGPIFSAQFKKLNDGKCSVVAVATEAAENAHEAVARAIRDGAASTGDKVTAGHAQYMLDAKVEVAALTRTLFKETLFERLSIETTRAQLQAKWPAVFVPK